MPNCYVCSKPAEILRLRSRIVSLENGDEIRKLKERIAELEREGSPSTVQDPASAQPKSTTELLLRIDKLESSNAAKDRRIEELEQNNREVKEQAERDRKTAKKRIDELERNLSKETWQREKDLRDQKAEHDREVKKLKESHEKELLQQQAEYEAKLQNKDKEIADLRKLQDPQAKVIPPPKVEAGESGQNKPVKLDSQNSSVPPIQDPGHPVIVSNNRVKSGKPVGGQVGHPHHPRKQLTPDEVIEIDPPIEVIEHPEDYRPTGEVIKKQRISLKIGICVTEYHALEYINIHTKKTRHGEFPSDLGHLEVNYDPSLEAGIAWLHSVGNMAYNKITELLKEKTDGMVCPSEGTMVNFEKRFAKATEEKREEIAKSMLADPYMNVDATFMRVGGKLQTVMVQNTDSGVFYTATGCKGQKAVDQTFAGEYHGTVVCDGEVTFHSLGEDYQRCLIHFSRALKGSMEFETWLTFPKKMHDFIWETVKKRDLQKQQGLIRMDEQELEKVRKEYGELIKLGEKEYKEHPPKSSYVKGYNTFLDLAKSTDHVLLFLTDYRIPWHNNDGEKAARGIKVHSRINGGMRSYESFVDHAKTMTVLETEHKQDESVSRMEALKEGFEAAKEEDGSAALRSKQKKEAAETMKAEETSSVPSAEQQKEKCA